MITVTPISHCKNLACKADIYVRDVYREKDVRTAPGHVVLMYQCSSCGLNGRIVGETEVWQDRQREASFAEYNHDTVVDSFADDLEVLVETPADLENIWASYHRPPMIEGMPRCFCQSCKERRNGPRA